MAGWMNTPSSGLNTAMIGYCGIDCSQCEAFIATQKNDNALRTRVAGVWAKLYGAPIQPEHINCTGCKSTDAKTYFCEHLCQVRKCAVDRSIDLCVECPDYPCAIVNQIIEGAQAAFGALNE